MLPVENRLGVSRGLDALSQRSARSASTLRVDEGAKEAASGATALDPLRPVRSEQDFNGSTSGQSESQPQAAQLPAEATEAAAAPASFDVISLRFDPELSSEARLASAKNASGKTFGRTRAPLRRAVTPNAAQLPGQGLRAYSSGQALAHQTANLTVDVVL